MRWDKWIVIFNGCVTCVLKTNICCSFTKQNKKKTERKEKHARSSSSVVVYKAVAQKRLSRVTQISEHAWLDRQQKDNINIDFDCCTLQWNIYSFFSLPIFFLLLLVCAKQQIMSSKRKSPPTKVLDGSNNNNNISSNNGIGSDTKLFHEHDDVMPATEIDLSIKSSSSPHSNNDIDTFNEQILNHNHRRGSPSPIIEQHNQMNGDKMSGNVKRRGGDIQVRSLAQLNDENETMI